MKRSILVQGTRAWNFDLMVDWIWYTRVLIDWLIGFYFPKWMYKGSSTTLVSTIWAQYQIYTKSYHPYSFPKICQILCLPVGRNMQGRISALAKGLSSGRQGSKSRNYLPTQVDKKFWNWPMYGITRKKFTKGCKTPYTKKLHQHHMSINHTYESYSSSALVITVLHHPITSLWNLTSDCVDGT